MKRVSVNCLATWGPEKNGEAEKTFKKLGIENAQI